MSSSTCGLRPYTKEFWYQEPRTLKLLANAADAWIPLRMTKRLMCKNFSSTRMLCSPTKKTKKSNVESSTI